MSRNGRKSLHVYCWVGVSENNNMVPIIKKKINYIDIIKIRKVIEMIYF